VRKKLGNITCDRIFDAEFESGVDDDTCQCKEYCDAWEAQKAGDAVRLHTHLGAGSWGYAVQSPSAPPSEGE